MLYCCRACHCVPEAPPSCFFPLHVGTRPEDGVRDMIVISDIDENGINTNLHVRYKQDIIYVSFCIWKKMLIGTVNCVSATRDGRLIMYYL